MTCAYHLDHPAAGLCTACDRALCVECLHASQPPGRCYDCVLAARSHRMVDHVGLLLKTAIAAALGAVAYHWYRSLGGAYDGAIVILTGLYLGITLFLGRHTVQRLTKGHGGWVVLGGASISKQADIWLIAGFVGGIALWLVVGVFSGPIELAICIVQLVRLRRGSRTIRSRMPRPVVAL